MVLAGKTNNNVQTNSQLTISRPIIVRPFKIMSRYIPRGSIHVISTHSLSLTRIYSYSLNSRPYTDILTVLSDVLYIWLFHFSLIQVFVKEIICSWATQVCLWWWMHHWRPFEFGWPWRDWRSSWWGFAAPYYLRRGLAATRGRMTYGASQHVRRVCIT